MVVTEYHYGIAMYRLDDSVVGQAPITPDWGPAEQCGRLEGIRRGLLQPDARDIETAAAPVWSPNAGEPFVHSVLVTVRGPDETEVQCEVPATYFASQAREASAAFVQEGKLQAGEQFRYLVLAHPGGPDRQGGPSGGSGGRIEAVIPAWTVVDSSREEFAADSEPFGVLDNADVPVYIAQEVLDQAAEITRLAGAMETGGILVGHLHRNAGGDGDLFLEVAAQIPAENGRGKLTSFTFTADAWAAARDTIRHRQAGEIMLGWWHAHNFMKETCRDCRERTAGTCATTALFLSPEDCSLHRTCFPRAYSVALVLADGPCSGLGQALYGWRRGLIDRRGFSIVHGAAAPAQPTHHPL